MLDPYAGWTLILIGISLVIVEILMPGQTFLIVGGVFFITLGSIGLATQDEGVTFGPIGLGVSLTITCISVVATVMLYQRLGKQQVPTTTVAESLIGQKGVVTKQINLNSMSGKVMIGATEWSARSDDQIKKGAYVEVLDSKGVHVVVGQIDPPRKKMSQIPRNGGPSDFELEEEDLEDY